MCFEYALVLDNKDYGNGDSLRHRHNWKIHKYLSTYKQELKPILKPTSNDENLPIAILRYESLSDITTKNLHPHSAVVKDEQEKISADNPQADLI